MKIYMAGRITGDKCYKRKFRKYEKILRRKGHSVMNPAWLYSYPEFTWYDYMEVSAAMMKCCDAILMLPGWETSKGACEEYKRAKEEKKTVFFSVDDIQKL